MGSKDFWGEEKPFVAGFLRGFRMWKINTESKDLKLQSTAFQDHSWMIGRNTAVCQQKLQAQLEAQTVTLVPQTLPCHCSQCVGSLPAILERRARNLIVYETHKAPGSSKDKLCNRCGFYAFHMPEFLDMPGDYVPDQMVGRFIFGSIKATGSIMLGTMGFRAEHVEVEALYDGGPAGIAVAERYGVPWFQNQAELTEQFPFTPMEGLEYERPSIQHLPSTSVPISGTGSIVVTMAGGRRHVVTGNATWMVGPGPTINLLPEEEDEEEEALPAFPWTAATPWTGATWPGARWTVIPKPPLTIPPLAVDEVPEAEVDD